MPRMPNRRNRKIKNTMTFPRLGSERNKDPTNLLMPINHLLINNVIILLLIVLIDLNGRNTLKTLRGFKFGIFGKNSRNLKNPFFNLIDLLTQSKPQ